MSKLFADSTLSSFALKFDSYSEYQSISEADKETLRGIASWDRYSRAWQLRLSLWEILWHLDNLIEAYHIDESSQGVVELRRFSKRLSEVASSEMLPLVKATFPFLYKHQAICVARALALHKLRPQHRAFNIFHAVGLGKTVTSLALAALLRGNPHRKVLVLAPPAILSQWQHEVERFFSNSYSPVIIKGSKKRREKLWSNGKQEANLLIVSWETFRNDVDLIPNDIAVVIADEASKIKNHSTKLYKATSKVVNEREAFFIPLTATPFENRLEDVYNISSVTTTIMPRRRFLNRYAVWGRVYNPSIRREVEIVLEWRNVEDFAGIIAPFTDRRTPDDIGVELPPVVEEWRSIDPAAGQVKAAELLIAKAKEMLGGENQKGAVLFLVWQLLRMLDNGLYEFSLSDSEIARQVLQELNITPPARDEPPKLKRLVEELDELNGKQILIFTSFIASANRIAFTIKEKLGKEVAVITGAQQGTERDKIVEKFKNKEIPYLVTTASLGRGVSFPHCDAILLYDLHPNPKEIEQRIGRIVRLDSDKRQTKLVIYFYSTIVEHLIADIIKRKIKWSNEFEFIKEVIAKRFGDLA